MTEAEEVKAKEKKHTVGDIGLIAGKWKLTYKLVNRLKEQGFSGRVIDGYQDPITGKYRPLIDANGTLRAGLMIDRVERILDPRDRNQRLIIDWLLGHPKVGISQKFTYLDGDYINNKENNPRINLINLDYAEIEDLDQEDFIDKLIGRISKDSGNDAIGLKKLRWINATLNLQYRDQHHISNPGTEKKKLRQVLKKYIRSSYENAQHVHAILTNLDELKYTYQIKEMVRLNIISVKDGMFMYAGNAMGISYDSIITYWKNNPEFYAELEGKLYAQLKAE